MIRLSKEHILALYSNIAAANLDELKEKYKESENYFYLENFKNNTLASKEAKTKSDSEIKEIKDFLDSFEKLFKKTNDIKELKKELFVSIIRNRFSHNKVSSSFQESETKYKKMHDDENFKIIKKYIFWNIATFEEPSNFIYSLLYISLFLKNFEYKTLVDSLRNEEIKDFTKEEKEQIKFFWEKKNQIRRIKIAREVKKTFDLDIKYDILHFIESRLEKKTFSKKVAMQKYAKLLNIYFYIFERKKKQEKSDFSAQALMDKYKFVDNEKGLLSSIDNLWKKNDKPFKRNLLAIKNKGKIHYLDFESTKTLVYKLATSQDRFIKILNTESTQRKKNLLKENEASKNPDKVKAFRNKFKKPKHTDLHRLLKTINKIYKYQIIKNDEIDKCNNDYLSKRLPSFLNFSKLVTSIRREDNLESKKLIKELYPHLEINYTQKNLLDDLNNFVYKTIKDKETYDEIFYKCKGKAVNISINKNTFNIDKIYFYGKEKSGQLHNFIEKTDSNLVKRIVLHIYPILRFFRNKTFNENKNLDIKKWNDISKDFPRITEYKLSSFIGQYIEKIQVPRNGRPNINDIHIYNSSFYKDYCKLFDKNSKEFHNDVIEECKIYLDKELINMAKALKGDWENNNNKKPIRNLLFHRLKTQKKKIDYNYFKKVLEL